MLVEFVREQHGNQRKRKTVRLNNAQKMCHTL